MWSDTNKKGALRGNELFCYHLFPSFLFTHHHIFAHLFFRKSCECLSRLLNIYKAFVYSLLQFANAFEQLIRVLETRELTIEKYLYIHSIHKGSHKICTFTGAFLFFYVSTREIKIKHVLAFKTIFRSFLPPNAPETSTYIIVYLKNVSTE